MGNPDGEVEPDRDDPHELLDTVAEGDRDSIDTATGYGDDRSDSGFGEWLPDRARGNFDIEPKCDWLQPARSGRTAPPRTSARRATPQSIDSTPTTSTGL